MPPTQPNGNRHRQQGQNKDNKLPKRQKQCLSIAGHKKIVPIHQGHGHQKQQQKRACKFGMKLLGVRHPNLGMHPGAFAFPPYITAHEGMIILCSKPAMQCKNVVLHFTVKRAGMVAMSR